MFTYFNIFYTLLNYTFSDKTKTILLCSFFLLVAVYTGAYEGGGRAPPPPSTRAPPERLRGGIHGGGSFNITSACISLPQVRHSGVPRGASSSLAPPGSSKNTKLKGNYV